LHEVAVEVFELLLCIDLVFVGHSFLSSQITSKRIVDCNGRKTLLWLEQALVQTWSMRSMYLSTMNILVVCTSNAGLGAMMATKRVFFSFFAADRAIPAPARGTIRPHSTNPILLPVQTTSQWDVPSYGSAWWHACSATSRSSRRVRK
jgi:hypothetical protein